MIRESSNQATQHVVARLTGTQPGPELPPAAYADFKQRRLSVNAWLRALGVTGLHCVNPTYDGDGDLSGRDVQFLKDRGVGGLLPARGDEFRQPQRHDRRRHGRSCWRCWRLILRSSPADRKPSASACAAIRRSSRT